jgi:hypothetical protein
MLLPADSRELTVSREHREHRERRRLRREKHEGDNEVRSSRSDFFYL